MIITTTTMMLVQAIIVTWIMVTAPTPCPQEYLDLGGDVIEYCELIPHGSGRQWSLKE
tara:strand:+ start:269 stop:442 length:174 start_codon:yes stop_codon:yes gene_type:complete